MINYSAAQQRIRIGFVVPLQGSAGIFGPSCEACADLAVAELNRRSGILGREVELVTIDGGADPAVVAAEVGDLADRGMLDAVTGWHISAVRKALMRRLSGRIPYVYPALHEGEFRSPGLYMTGESPRDQLLPALAWLATEIGARRWSVVGNDYVWPTRMAAHATSFFAAHGLDFLGSSFVPLGSRDFTSQYRWLSRQMPDAVLVLLVGDDAVHFSRGFARLGLDSAITRFSPILEENQVLAMGAGAGANMYSAAGYFESLPTTGSLEFSRRYHQRFGIDAPALGSIGQSCYEAISLLASMATRSGSLAVGPMHGGADGTVVEGTRGTVRVQGNNVAQDVYLARVAALDLEIVDRIHVA
jgi:ABC-type branched-subunit amino acid transport system substrate-binding protein